jgi:hypothetical protein
MKPIQIRSGLRKLEFEVLPIETEESDADRVLVEFVRATPLESSDTVRVELGLREGWLREIIGQPQLVETAQEAGSKRQYVYRLHGKIGGARR